MAVQSAETIYIRFSRNPSLVETLSKWSKDYMYHTIQMSRAIYGIPVSSIKETTVAQKLL